jgi:hypothetical protein
VLVAVAVGAGGYAIARSGSGVKPVQPSQPVGATTPRAASIIRARIRAALIHERERSFADSCPSSQLRLTMGERVSEATQQHTVLLIFHNTSAHTCLLYGYPRIELLDGGGAVLPFSYRHHRGLGDLMLTNNPPVPVSLRAGGNAYFAINKIPCAAFERRFAAVAQAAPPNEQHVLQVALDRPEFLLYCPPRDAGHYIDVTPIEPTRNAAFGQP